MYNTNVQKKVKSSRKPKQTLHSKLIYFIPFVRAKTLKTTKIIATLLY